MKQIVSLFLGTFLLLVGCKDVRIANGTDDQFVHLPANLQATPPPPLKPLMPGSVGSTWSYRFTNTDGDLEKVIVAPSRMVNGSPAMVLVSTRTGAPKREEVLQISAQKIMHVSSSGGEDLVNLKPPMPLVQFPLSFDTVLSWQGGVLLKGSLVPSKGTSKLRGIEKINVPAGEFMAYRIDSMLETQLSAGKSIFWTTRWFAPGVGMVKVRYIVNAPKQADRVFVKELVKYKI
jgi:hypothetical protein